MAANMYAIVCDQAAVELRSNCDPAAAKADASGGQIATVKRRPKRTHHEVDARALAVVALDGGAAADDGGRQVALAPRLRLVNIK